MIELGISSDINLPSGFISISSSIVGLCKTGAIFSLHGLPILVTLRVNITYRFHVTRNENPVIILFLTANAFVLMGLGVEGTNLFRANNFVVISSRSGTSFTQILLHSLSANHFATVLILHEWIAKRLLFIWTSKVLLMGEESAM